MNLLTALNPKPPKQLPKPVSTIDMRPFKKPTIDGAFRIMASGETREESLTAPGLAYSGKKAIGIYEKVGG